MAIFTIFFGNTEKGQVHSICTTNMRTLSEKAGIGYSNLVRIFTREKKHYWVHPMGYTILKSDVFFRGKGNGLKGRFRVQKKIQ